MNGSDRHSTTRFSLRDVLILRGIIVGLVIAASLSISQSTLVCQPNDRTSSLDLEGGTQARLTLGGGFGIIQVSGAVPPSYFNDATNGQECGQFSSGTGSTPMVDAGFGLRISPSFWIDLSTTWTPEQSNMRFECVDVADIRLNDGSTTQAITEHVFEQKRSSLEVAATVEWQPVSESTRFDGLFLAAGIGLQFPLVSTFEVREEIVSPSNASFVSGGQERVSSKGDLQEGGAVVRVLMEAGYELKAGSQIGLRPFIRYEFGLGSEVNDIDVRRSYASIGLNLAYHFSIMFGDGSSPLEPRGK